MIQIVEYGSRPDLVEEILSRSGSFSPEVEEAVAGIIAAVRERGDDAIRELTERYDGVRLEQIKVPREALLSASKSIDDDLRRVIEAAAGNIRRFHEHQVHRSWFVEDGDGVVLGQRVVPMDRVGLYVPGGTAFYPSSLLMNAIPAQVAGVQEIHLVSPPTINGLPHPAVLATAHFLGLENVYAVGGAQAVAALAYGTPTIPRVDKIVGPGNAYVAAAKRSVYGPVDIDAIAGPTEVVILADESADAEFVAADLLAQAEHDVRASAILVTTHRELAEQVKKAIEDMLPGLSRRAILEKSLSDYGYGFVTGSMDEAVSLVNSLASEHLELHVREPWQVLTRIRHAGAIFLGPYSSEPVGDYFAGPNHVLPTGGTARYASALSVDDFIRKQSVIAYTEERLRKTGPDIVRFANAEALTAHARAIEVRLNRR